MMGRNRSSVLVVVAAVALTMLDQGVQAVSLLDKRHKPPSLDRAAGSIYGEYSESALLTTPCNPEEDGYFGGTFGDPVEFQFAFEMETSVDAETPKALDIIRNHVVDVVVADTFPQLCGSEGRHLRGRNSAKPNQQSKVTGFRFDKMPRMDFDDRCEPLLDESNYCGVFKSTITVFGHQLQKDDALHHIMSTVVDAIGSSRTMVAPQGVMRMVPSEQKTRIIFGGELDYFTGKSGSDDGATDYLNNMSPAVTAVLAFTSTTLVLGVLLVGSRSLPWSRSSKEKRNRAQRGDFGVFTAPENVTLVGDESDTSYQEQPDTIYLQDPGLRGQEYTPKRVVFQLDTPIEDKSYYDNSSEIDSTYPPQYYLD